jgi:hypothetical protein
MHHAQSREEATVSGWQVLLRRTFEMLVWAEFATLMKRLPGIRMMIVMLLMLLDSGDGWC